MYVIHNAVIPEQVVASQEVKRAVEWMISKETNFQIKKSQGKRGPVIDSGCISAANFLWRHKHEMKLYPNDPINGKNSSQPPVITWTERFSSVFARQLYTYLCY